MSQPQPHRILASQMEPGWRFLHPMSPIVFTVETIDEDVFGDCVIETSEGLAVEFWFKQEAEVFIPGYLR